MSIWTDSKRKLVYTIGEDGYMKVFDLTADAITNEIQVSGSKLTCMVTDRKTGIAFIGDKKGVINVFDLASVTNFIRLYFNHSLESSIYEASNYHTLK